MKLALTIFAIVLLVIHFVISLLAIMQGRRFKFLSRTSTFVTWGYGLLVTAVGITIVVLLFSLEP